MKKNKNVLLLALSLALIAAFLVYQNKKGTMREELKDFAVSDTASVTKIFLADKSGHSVLLERKDAANWTVNAKYAARPESINMLLKTMKGLLVKTRVAKAAYNNVIKDLAANAVKCEIYQHGETKPFKVYYVGGSTADVLGTFMMLENSTLPFVVEIPGFQGYLTPRYPTFESEWRDRTIFNYQANDIKNITIRYFQQPEKSFSIDHTGTKYSVSSLETHLSIQRPDTIGLINYFSFFNHLSFEAFDVEFTSHQVDSMKASTPLNSITVTDTKGVSTTIVNYPKPITLRSLAQSDSTGKPLKYDVDRLYSFMNNGKDLVVIQYYVFGKIFRQLSDFDADKRHSKLN